METAPNTSFSVLFPKYVELAQVDKQYTNENLQYFIKHELPSRVEMVKKLQGVLQNFMAQYTNLIIKRPNASNLSYSLASKAQELLDRVFKELQMKFVKMDKNSLADYFENLNPRGVIGYFRTKMMELEELLTEKYINNRYLARQKEEDIAQTLYVLFEVYHFCRSDLVTISSKHQIQQSLICNRAFNFQSLDISEFSQLICLDQKFEDYIESIVQKRCRPYHNKKDSMAIKIRQIRREAQMRQQRRVQANMLTFVESLISKQKHRIVKEVTPQIQSILKNVSNPQDQKQCKQITQKVDSLKRKFMNIKNNGFYMDIVRGSFGQKYKIELGKLENLYYLSSLEKYLQEVMDFVEELLNLQDQIIINRDNFKNTLSQKVQQQINNLYPDNSTKIQDGLTSFVQSQFARLEELLYGADVEEEPQNYRKGKVDDQNKNEQIKAQRQLKQQKMQEQRKRKAEYQAQQRKIKEEERKKIEETRKMKQKQEEEKRKIRLAEQKLQKQKRDEQQKRKQEEDRKKRSEQMSKKQKQIEEKKKQQQRKRNEDKQRKQREQKKHKQEEQQRRKADQQRKKQQQQEEKQKRQQQVRRKKENEDRLKREEQQKKIRELQNAKNKQLELKGKKLQQEEQRKQRQLKAKKQKQETQRRDKQLQQTKKKEELEVKRMEEQRRKKQQQDRKREEEDRKRQQQTRKKQQEQLKKQEEERKKKDAEAAKLKMQEENKKKQAEEKKRKQEQEQKKREKEEQKIREEIQRKKAEQKKKKQDEQTKRKQEEERKKKTEQIKKQELERAKAEQEKKRKEIQAEQKRKKQEQAKLKKQAEEKKKQMQLQKIKLEQQKKAKEQGEKLRKEEQKAKSITKAKPEGKKSSGINYGEVEDELIDQNEDLKKPSKGVSKPIFKKPQEDQYVQNYDDDFDEFSPQKAEEGEEPEGQQPLQLIELEDLKCLNDYMKGTSYARKNKPNLELFNNVQQYAYLFEEFTLSNKFYIYADASITKAIQQFSKQLSDENVPEQELKLTLESINEALAEQNLKNNTQQLNPETRLIFPLSFQSDLGIYLVQISLAQGYIIIVFQEEPSNNQEYHSKLENFVQAFRHIYEVEEGLKCIPVVVPPDSKSVLDTFDKELPFLLLLFVMHYEQDHDFSTPLLINQYTIERFFYTSHVLKPFYEAIQKDQDNVATFYANLNKKYAESDKIKIVPFETNTKNEDYNSDIREASVAIKGNFLQDKKAKHYLAMIQLINSTEDEDEEAEFNKIVIYFSMSKQDAGKPTLTYYIISADDQEEQLVYRMFEWVSDEIDNEFETVVYRDFTRHNGLSQYSDWSLGLWAHIVQKRKMTPIQGFRAITLSMAPYFVAYKQMD